MEAGLRKVILGIDPGFKKCGFGVIGLENGEYIESMQKELRPARKLTQTQLDGHLSRSISKIIKDLFVKYDIRFVVIELQFSQFSVSRIELAFVMSLPADVPYTIQHSKFKLQHCDLPPPDNPSSSQYQKNKHQGRQLAKIIFPGIPNISFDECDSLLHARYALENLKKIKWVKKCDLGDPDDELTVIGSH